MSASVRMPGERRPAARGETTRGPGWMPGPRGERRPVRGSAVEADRGAAGADLAVGASLHVHVHPLDLVHLEAEGAPGRHPLVRASGADRGDERLLGGDGPAVLEGDDQRRGEGGPDGVLAMAAGAVELVLLPPLVRLVVHGVTVCRMIRTRLPGR